jgi:hypothetical protein
LFTLYDARHTFVSTLMAAGVPLPEVAAYSGHSVGELAAVAAGDGRLRSQTTLAVYTHATGQRVNTRSKLSARTSKSCSPQRPGCARRWRRNRKWHAWVAVVRVRSRGSRQAVIAAFLAHSWRIERVDTLVPHFSRPLSPPT